MLQRAEEELGRRQAAQAAWRAEVVAAEAVARRGIRDAQQSGACDIAAVLAAHRRAAALSEALRQRRLGRRGERKALRDQEARLRGRTEALQGQGVVRLFAIAEEVARVYHRCAEHTAWRGLKREEDASIIHARRIRKERDRGHALERVAFGESESARRDAISGEHQGGMTAMRSDEEAGMLAAQEAMAARLEAAAAEERRKEAERRRDEQERLWKQEKLRKEREVIEAKLRSQRAAVENAETSARGQVLTDRKAGISVWAEVERAALKLSKARAALGTAWRRARTAWGTPPSLEAAIPPSRMAPRIFYTGPWQQPGPISLGVDLTHVVPPPDGGRTWDQLCHDVSRAGDVLRGELAAGQRALRDDAPRWAEALATCGRTARPQQQQQQQQQRQQDPDKSKEESPPADSQKASRAAECLQAVRGAFPSAQACGALLQQAQWPDTTDSFAFQRLNLLGGRVNFKVCPEGEEQWGSFSSFASESGDEDEPSEDGRGTGPMLSVRKNYDELWPPQAATQLTFSAGGGTELTATVPAAIALVQVANRTDGIQFRHGNEGNTKILHRTLLVQFRLTYPSLVDDWDVPIDQAFRCSVEVGAQVHLPIAVAPSLIRRPDKVLGAARWVESEQSQRPHAGRHEPLLSDITVVAPPQTFMTGDGKFKVVPAQQDVAGSFDRCSVQCTIENFALDDQIVLRTGAASEEAGDSAGDQRHDLHMVTEAGRRVILCDGSVVAYVADGRLLPVREAEDRGEVLQQPGVRHSFTVKFLSAAKPAHGRRLLRRLRFACFARSLPARQPRRRVEIVVSDRNGAASRLMQHIDVVPQITENNGIDLGGQRLYVAAFAPAGVPAALRAHLALPAAPMCPLARVWDAGFPEGSAELRAVLSGGVRGDGLVFYPQPGTLLRIEPHTREIFFDGGTKVGKVAAGPAVPQGFDSGKPVDADDGATEGAGWLRHLEKVDDTVLCVRLERVAPEWLEGLLRSLCYTSSLLTPPAGRDRHVTVTLSFPHLQASMPTSPIVSPTSSSNMSGAKRTSASADNRSDAEAKRASTPDGKSDAGGKRVSASAAADNRSDAGQKRASTSAAAESRSESGARTPAPEGAAGEHDPGLICDRFTFRLCPPLFEIRERDSHMEYREGAGMVKLAPFEVALDSSASGPMIGSGPMSPAAGAPAERTFCGGYLRLEMVEGSTTDDVLNLKTGRHDEIKIKLRKGARGVLPSIGDQTVSRIEDTPDGIEATEKSLQVVAKAFMGQRRRSRSNSMFFATGGPSGVGAGAGVGSEREDSSPRSDRGGVSFVGCGPQIEIPDPQEGGIMLSPVAIPSPISTVGTQSVASPAQSQGLRKAPSFFCNAAPVVASFGSGGGSTSPKAKDRLRDHMQRFVRSSMSRQQSIREATTDLIGILNRQKRAGIDERAGRGSITVSDIWVGSKYVGTLTVSHTQLLVRFAKGAQRKEVQSIMRALAYSNCNSDPEVLNKVLRITLRDSTQFCTQSVYSITITPVDNVTDIRIGVPTVSYRPGMQSLHRIGAFPVAGVRTACLSDPDTSHFDGGALTVDFISGAVRGDTLWIMSPEQQEMARLDGDAYAERVEALRAQASAINISGPVITVLKDKDTFQLDNMGTPIHEVAAWQGTLEVVESGPGAKKRIRSSDGIDVGTIDFVRSGAFSNVSALRISFAKHQPPKIHMQLAAYVMNCITFSTSAEKIQPGLRQVVFKLRDAANPQEGKGKVSIDVKRPLMAPGAGACLPGEVLTRQVSVTAQGKAAQLLEQVRCTVGDGSKGAHLTAGYTTITVLEGLQEGDELYFLPGVVQIREGQLFNGTEFLAEVSTHSPGAMVFEHGWASKLTGKALERVLQATALRVAERGDRVVQFLCRDAPVLSNIEPCCIVVRVTYT
eukprot:TRINITY_DN3081_c0_g1_i3.p1 TRINITY_DN3081_c0_g1~~TRINITY_DN3081_c0_g1_i3.p1  ORF type:complete len:2137 (+),score=614.76 TRINITY_DN3081_c0_g1_i3:759-6413(+)